MSDARPEKKTRDYTIFDDEMETRGFDFGLIVRLMRWMRPYRRQGLIALVFVLLAASAAVLAPVVVSRVVVDGILLPTSDAGAPDFGQKALNAFLSSLLDLHPIVAACILYGVWTVLWAAFGHGFRVMLARTVLNGLRDLRRDLFAHLETRPSSFYDRVAVGRVMTRLTNDIETLFELLAGFGVLLGEFVPFFVAVSIMLALNPTLTFELMLLLPLAALATWAFRIVSRQVYRGIRSTMSRLNENLQENLSGIEVVQLYGREEINFQRYTGINEENREQENLAVRIESYYGPAMDSMAFLAMAAIIWFGGQHVFEGAATLGSVILFAQFADMMFRPIVAMGEQWNVVFRAMASCERIFQALDWDEALKEPEEPKPLPKDLKGQVTFNHLTFGYTPGTTILKDVSFDIKPGERIAIVGPTGSGKTSLIRLLCRFYDVPANSILIDGIDIMDVMPSEIRQRVGVVLQDFHIFSGTVYDNIALGNPAITREMAREAARLVHADPFIRTLPQGYDTMLTERGRNLSHGQRQLLAFARVLAMNPEVLVLDEATASIDTETELVIQDALSKVTQGRTSIIIAHRLQTIREADRIVVLAGGEVREIGSHDELIAIGGLYKTLYELQVQDVAGTSKNI
ncbi:ABC transporter related [Parvibaculum lavamentivorans DS-1]|uniref:ABC transporter related n=1 Tax=Parvibaculum lavamentivorans (strain DS-1 / DSM 13023 / NCIMB 13966) TaxID=402881 RepID=A7HRA7_PARL1|nr:ABC transporter ATP-binding protein [Parvibaculum lavamentivorans]ABS62440.1 ABC transporter related [Parvibaculum lavamentivorans DS-1]